MKTSFCFWAGLLAVASHAALGQTPRTKPTAAYSAEGKTAAVYTTAANTNVRLAAGQPLAFQPVGQPLEKDFYVLLDPDHSF